MVIELVPDFSVDIPLIWQYIGEIIGAFVGGPLSNMLLLKPILQMIPDEKTKQLFQYTMRFAIELSVSIKSIMCSCFTHIYWFVCILVQVTYTKTLAIIRFYIK